MRIRGIFAVAVTGVAVAAAAIASETIAHNETITYKYDARGRLVKVERSGGVNDKVKAEYRYDKADNRTNVNVISPNSPP